MKYTLPVHHLLGLLVLGAAMPIHADGSAPRLTADAAEHDFGSALSGGSVEHTFTLTNRGEADLIIEKVKPACGCTTAAAIENKTLNPSQSLELPVSMSLKGRSGAQRKSISIFSNDPRQPEFKVWIIGEAVQPISVQPSTIALGRIQRGVPFAIAVELTSGTGRQFAVRKVLSSSKHLKGEVEEVIAGEMYRVNVSVIGDLPAGQIRHTLTVETTDPDVPFVSIPITGHAMDQYAVAPKELLLLSGAEPSTRYIIVGPGAIERFEVIAVDAPSADIETKILKAGKRGYRVRLSGIRNDGSLDGKVITIRTDSEKSPVIQVPIRLIADEHKVTDDAP